MRRRLDNRAMRGTYRRRTADGGLQSVRPLTPAESDEVVRLRIQGVDIADIARRFGRKYHTIFEHLMLRAAREEGLPIRERVRAAHDDDYSRLGPPIGLTEEDRSWQRHLQAADEAFAAAMAGRRYDAPLPQ